MGFSLFFEVKSAFRNKRRRQAASVSSSSLLLLLLLRRRLAFLWRGLLVLQAQPATDEKRQLWGGMSSMKQSTSLLCPFFLSSRALPSRLPPCSSLPFASSAMASPKTLTSVGGAAAIVLLTLAALSCEADALVIKHIPIPGTSDSLGFASGNATAPVKLEAFFDLMCGDCRNIYSEFKSVLVPSPSYNAAVRLHC